MTEGDMLKITVPGSTANLGPGFDSVGLALGKYLTLEVKKADERIFLPMTDHVKDIPTNDQNLIAKVAIKVAEKYNQTLPACEVKVWSDIPMARGIGSSAAAIIAGIELSNQLCDLQLTDEEKLRIASLEEGHPDNVGASLYGGLVVGLHQEDKTELVCVKEVNVDAVVVIPKYEVFTSDARNVLPQELAYKTAVEASAISNMLIAGLLTNDWHLVGNMMSKDLFHQPYRGKLIPEIQAVQEKVEALGAYGSALSGAGPTVICFIERGKGSELAEKLAHDFKNCDVECLDIDLVGCRVEQVQEIKSI
ncbi:homoserine kinase [Metabacillus litoralis]|uniref:homoserine kinase n=1 Tax=Metabacillus TaxID=2675233 RepID=UPI000EF59E76|nr:homoserine kinase [Metabacillus litoralis]MCM3161176.1 homoserine kinase [Metabacillus litoralis]MCM3412050.1 homoserine kinase [Metabacillus litoralis]UHA61941.1 homoserine kinase [Metabacillus litoralis]